MLGKVADLKDEVIDFNKRFAGWDGLTQCLILIDGTDCPVQEPWPFYGQWYSSKFNGPAVKYEVGVCIKTGFIVWLNGPFVASKNDGRIFRETLEGLLAADESVEVDGGYKGSDKMKGPTAATSQKDRKQKLVVRGHHENVNGFLKVYNVQNFPFHHSGPSSEPSASSGPRKRSFSSRLCSRLGVFHRCGASKSFRAVDFGIDRWVDVGLLALQ